MVIYANCKKFKGKNGVAFYSMSIKGERILDAAKKERETTGKDFKAAIHVNGETYYAVRAVGGGCPQKEGVFKITFDVDDGWIDLRKDFKDKHILRIKEPIMEFYKAFEDKAKAPEAKVAKEDKEDIIDDLPF